MAAKKASKKAKEAEVEPAKEASQGRAVLLPDGTRRVDYIRDQYYNKKATRSEIKNAINKMLEDAGKKDEQIPYQIVFAATKQKPDEYTAALKAKAEEAKKAKAAE